MAQTRVGVQLIVYGRRAGADLPGVLTEVAAADYAGFEGGLPRSEAEVERLRTAAKKAGIAYIGGHGGLGDLKDLTALRKRIGYVKALGGRFVISSGDSSLNTLDGYLDAAKTMNQAGRVCQEEGVTLCYHNHHWEFRKIGGKVAMHAMIAATDPELVKLCPDIYWVHVGGEKPAEFSERYRDRCIYFHFKDGTGGDGDADFRELGKGKVDIPAALKAALACKPEWIVVEQDTSQIGPTESCRISREYLKGLGI
jgi:sugar phosphate isomerase/epimerase